MAKNVDASPGFPQLEEDLLEALDQMTQDAADMSEGGRHRSAAEGAASGIGKRWLT